MNKILSVLVIILLLLSYSAVSASDSSIKISFDPDDDVAEYITQRLLQQIPELQVDDADPDVQLLAISPTTTGMFYNSSLLEPELNEVNTLDALRYQSQRYQERVLSNLTVLPLVSLFDLYDNDRSGNQLDTKWINNTQLKIVMSNKSMIRDDLDIEDIVVHPSLIKNGSFPQTLLYTGSLAYIFQSEFYSNHANEWQYETNDTTGLRIHTIGLNNSLEFEDGKPVSSNHYLLSMKLLSATCSVAYEPYYSNIEYEAINDTVLEIRSNQSLFHDLQYLSGLYPTHDVINTTLSRTYLNDVIKFTPDQACYDPRMDPILTDEFIDYSTSGFISAGPMRIINSHSQIRLEHRYNMNSTTLFNSDARRLLLSPDRLELSFEKKYDSMKMMNKSDQFRAYHHGNLEMEMYILQFKKHIPFSIRRSISHRIDRDLLSTPQLNVHTSIYPISSIFYESYNFRFFGFENPGYIQSYTVVETITQTTDSSLYYFLTISIWIIPISRRYLR